MAGFLLLSLLVIILSVLALNLGVKRLLHKWGKEAWIKSFSIFLLGLIITPGIGGALQSIVNTSLQGMSGGIEMIGVGIAAGFSVIIMTLLFLLLNFTWLIIRLVRRRV